MSWPVRMLRTERPPFLSFVISSVCRKPTIRGYHGIISDSLSLDISQMTMDSELDLGERHRTGASLLLATTPSARVDRTWGRIRHSRYEAGLAGVVLLMQPSKAAQDESLSCNRPPERECAFHGGRRRIMRDR
jgi:hypothetical protein